MRLQNEGLASGFLAGFRTMADYISQQKADARADKSLSMQEAEQKDNKEYRDKTWNNTLERQGVEDARYTDETTYNRKRQGDIDALNKQQVYSQMANDKARTGIAAQHARIAADAAKQQSKLVDMQISAAEQQQWTQENWGVLRGGWNNVVSGRPLTEQQAAALTDKRSGAMNITKYTDKNYVSAVTGLQSSVNNIMSTFKPEQFHSPEFFQQLNSPQMKQQMSLVFKDEIRRNVGYVDKSGKKVVDKEYAGIVPQQDGSLAIEVTPVYEDGTKGQPQPVTVNRSNDPNDQVRTFAPSDIVGVINARAQIARSIKNPETLLQDIGVAPAADTKGYRKAMAEAIAETQKTKAKIDMDVARGKIEAKDAETMKAAEDTSLQTLIQSYKPVFGLDEPATGDTEANPNRRAITQWVGNDPQKQQYLQKILNGQLKGGSFDLDTGDVKKLDGLYKIYQTEQKNQSLEQAALQEKVDRATRNQTRY